MRADELIKLMFPNGGMTVQANAPHDSSDEGGGMPSLSDGIAQAGSAIGAGLQKRGEARAAENAVTYNATPEQTQHMQANAPMQTNGVVPGAPQRSPMDVMNMLYPTPSPAPMAMNDGSGNMGWPYPRDAHLRRKPYEHDLFGA